MYTHAVQIAERDAKWQRIFQAAAKYQCARAEGGFFFGLLEAPARLLCIVAGSG